MNKCAYVVLLFNQIMWVFQRSDDYFTENFDVNKNCKKEDLIKKLLKEHNFERCSVRSKGDLSWLCTPLKFTYSFFKGNDELQWESCKKDLMKKVTKQCYPREIKKVDRNRTK